MPRLSLQTRFQLAILMVLGIVVLAMLLMWQRQQDSHHQVIDVTRQAMHGLLSEQVRRILAAPVYDLAIETPLQAAVRETQEEIDRLEEKVPQLLGLDG